MVVGRCIDSRSGFCIGCCNIAITLKTPKPFMGELRNSWQPPAGASRLNWCRAGKANKLQGIEEFCLIEGLWDEELWVKSQGGVRVLKLLPVCVTAHQDESTVRQELQNLFRFFKSVHVGHHDPG